MFLSDLMSDGNTELVAAASNSFSRPFCQEKSEVIVKGGGIHVEKKSLYKVYGGNNDCWSHLVLFYSIPWILNSHQCLCVPAGYLPDSDVVFKSRRNGHIYEMGHYNVVLTIWNLFFFLKG